MQLRMLAVYHNNYQAAGGVCLEGERGFNNGVSQSVIWRERTWANSR